MLYLKDIVHNTGTNESGHLLRVVLEKAISGRKPVTISLKGSLPMSTSFLNSAVGDLIDKYGFDTFKQFVRFSEMSASSAKAIKDYLRSCDIAI